MSGRMDVMWRVLAPTALDEKVKAEAERLGLSRSAFLRFIASNWCDPDGETIRRLVDPPVVYDTEGK